MAKIDVHSKHHHRLHMDGDLKWLPESHFKSHLESSTFTAKGRVLNPGYQISLQHHASLSGPWVPWAACSSKVLARGCRVRHMFTKHYWDGVGAKGRQRMARDC